MRSHVIVPRRIVAAFLLLSLTACQGWTPTSMTPPVSVISAEQPSSIRITLPNGEKLVLDNPIVRNDSIVAMVGSGRTQWLAEDINRIEIRHFSLGQSIGMALVVLFVVTIIGSIAFYNDLTSGGR